MSKIPYSEHVSKDRRLSILKILKASPAYTANEHLIRMLIEDYGLYPSQDTLRADFAWLEEVGVIELKDTANIKIATLTIRGQDAAEGRTIIPGIKRPNAGG